MSTPYGIAIDPTSGAVFVSDFDHNRVLRYPDLSSLTTARRRRPLSASLI